MSAGAPLLDRLDRQLGRVSGLLGIMGGLAILALMLVTVAAVVWRYLLNDPIFGIQDLSSMALTVAVAGAIAFGARRGAHISVDVISFIGGRRLTRATDVLARALGAAMVGFASYALFVKGACGLPCGAITNNLSIVHTPFYYALGAAMACYALILAVQLAAGLAHWSDPVDPSEGG